jgi:glucose-6-phosphate isomerase
VILSLHHDRPESESSFARFQAASVLKSLKALDSRARRKGLEALDPARGALIPIGMEIENGRVVKNGYGVFDLPWQAEEHREWPDKITAELDEIRKGIRAAHRVPVKFLIWAGMGGSAEDKAMYQAVGLLRRGPRLYLLDSTDPAKLDSILADMKKRSGLQGKDLLRRTLVVGMAMGMTSYEPVVNLQKLAAMFDAAGVDSRPNFYYMTFPGSLLDQFAAKRGYRRVPLQLDEANTTAGRHSAPMNRGSLYALGLAGVDLRAWMEGAFLSEEEVSTAWRLASFLHTQGLEGRDKVTLLLPRAWAGAGIWTKQAFEESLGKSTEFGLKIVIDERVRLTNYCAPKDSAQDRLFLCVQMKGEQNEKLALLRRAGYPVAALMVPKNASLSRYMQFVHYAVFGLAWLRKINFVTQPNVELYKTITNKLFGIGTRWRHREDERVAADGRDAAQIGLARTRDAALGQAAGGDSRAGRDCSGALCIAGEALHWRPEGDLRRTHIFRRHTLFAARQGGAHSAGSGGGTAVSRAAENARGCLRRSGDESLISRNDHRAWRVFFDHRGYGERRKGRLPSCAIASHADGARRTRAGGGVDRAARFGRRVAARVG